MCKAGWDECSSKRGLTNFLRFADSSFLFIMIVNEVYVLFFFKSMTAIFNLFHLMTHINQSLKFCSTPQNIFFADLAKIIGIILISCTMDGYLLVVILKNLFIYRLIDFREGVRGM